jgi:hypothetical protein
MTRNATAALTARQESDWPSDPWRVKRARVTVTIYNTRHDPGAFDTPVRDALSGILYHDDRYVTGGPQESPITAEGKGRVIHIKIEAMEVLTPQAAARKRVASETQKIARALKKGA